MDGVIELKDVYYENAYIGYKSNMLPFMAEKLKEYVEHIPSGEDFDRYQVVTINVTTKIILEIENLETDELLLVTDLLHDSVSWREVGITKK